MDPQMHALPENKNRDFLPKRAISLREFGELYGFGRSKTYLLIKEGRLRSLKVGGKRLIRVDDAEELITGGSK
jgi:excisionase family DNA binding protein